MKDIATFRGDEFEPVIDRLTAPTPAGCLSARLLRPAIVDEAPAPLVVLHGISRNAAELTRKFAAEATRTGRMIVVPEFDAAHWPHFQRPSRAARPDVALAGLLEHLRQIDPTFRRTVQIFGHSGGAQLAHRFAMLYPQRIQRLSLAAAGWYCLPNDSMAYPYGLGAGETANAALWARRHVAGLARFLALPVDVFVGTQDTLRDETLRKTASLDNIQGRTRVARAHAFKRAFETAASVRGIAPAVSLTELPGVDHDVVRAIETANLARRVAGPDAMFPNHAS